MKPTYDMKLEYSSLHMNDLPTFLEIRNECRDSLHDNRYFTLMDALDWWKKNWGSYTYADGNQKRYWRISKPGMGGYRDGMIGYIRTESDNDNKVITVGVDLHKECRGQGFGQEVYKKIFDFYFKDSTYNRIQLEVLSTNKETLTFYKKIGFRQKGIRRQDVYREDTDTFIDSIMMSITTEEWKRDNGKT